jgi:hypothetical protein
MNAPLILGAVGTGIGLVRAVPQLVMLLRRREAFGVSVDSAGTSSHRREHHARCAGRETDRELPGQQAVRHPAEADESWP